MLSINHFVTKYFEERDNGFSNFISGVDLLRNLNQKENIFLLDTSPEISFKEFHIKGSHNIPLIHLEDSLGTLPRDKKIIVVCYRGQVSIEINMLLKMLGYETQYLKDGLRYLSLIEEFKEWVERY